MWLEEELGNWGRSINGETIKRIGEGEVDELMNADATLILTLTPTPTFGYITQTMHISDCVYVVN